MKSTITIFTLAILTACSPASNSSKQDHTNFFDNVSRVEVYGDSLRIEYEVYDNKTIQHRIDLKGTKDDGFDNSFTVTSYWSRRTTTQLQCDERVKLRYKNLVFLFCTTDVLAYYEQIPAESIGWNKEDIESIMRALNKDKQLIELKNMSRHLPFEWITDIDFQTIDVQANDTIHSIIIEQYDTPFSNGKNFYIVNDQGDTTSQIHMNEWMK